MGRARKQRASTQAHTSGAQATPHLRGCSKGIGRGAIEDYYEGISTNPAFINMVLMMDREAITELEGIEAKLNELLPRLGKHKVRILNQQIAKFYAVRWKLKHRKIARYGTLDKGFNEQELQAFFNVIDNDKYRLLFKFQSYLGLRIGEAVKVNQRDINLKTREIIVYTEKARVINTLIVPVPLFEEAIAFIQANQEQINQAQGYLFYADKNKSRTRELYLNTNYARKVFRQYCRLAGLNDVYANSEETMPNKPSRALFRLTSHSLRHYAITKFCRATNGNLLLTSRYARHQNPTTTLIYAHTDKTELYSVIEKML